jgi:hypothetical protein
MGGGLVLFGIGGGTNGGLLDAFNGGGGGSNSGNKTLEKQIAAAQIKLNANPQNQAALQQIIRGNYQLAGLSVDTNTGAYTSDGKADLQKAANAWEKYLSSNPAKPNVTLANYMFQAYGQTGLNKPAKAEKAAVIIAADQNSSAAYIRVVQYATLAGDKRTADLAAQKAVGLASKSERSSVKQAVKAAQSAGTTTQAQNGSSGSGG